MFQVLIFIIHLTVTRLVCAGCQDYITQSSKGWRRGGRGAGLYLPTPADSSETEDWRKEQTEKHSEKKMLTTTETAWFSDLNHLIRTHLIQVQSERTWILDPPETDSRFLNFYLKQEVRAGGAAADSSHGEFTLITLNCRNSGPGSGSDPAF